MKPIYDGGPAFPMCDGHSGMSLRDWFAGMALPSKITEAEAFNEMARRDGFQAITKENVADSCYRYADSMLEARKKS